MKKPSLKARLLAYHQKRPGVRIPSAEMQRIVTASTSYTAQNVGRRLRELAEDGELEVSYTRGHAFYSYNPPRFQGERKIVIVDGVAKEVYQAKETKPYGDDT